MASKQKSGPLSLAVLGAGENFTRNVLPALNAHVDYTVKWIFDARTEDQYLAGMPQTVKLAADFEYYQVTGYLQRFPPGTVDAVIESTPSRYRANNVDLSLSHGFHVYAEKPFTISHEGIEQTEMAIARNPSQVAYFAEYYRDDKALGMRVVSGEIKPGDWYEKFFKEGIDHRLQQALQSIGPIVHIQATTLEGSGVKSGLSHRLWVGDKDQGGQLLDMSTHLFTFLPLLRHAVGEVTVERVFAGICREAEQEYAEKTGRQIAETYAEVQMRSQNGFPITFSFGKYTGISDRVLEIEGKHGFIFVNFDTQKMTVETPRFGITSTIETVPKYSVLMQDFDRRVRDPQMHHQYAFQNAKETLQLILKAREAMTRADTFRYDHGEIRGVYEIVHAHRDL